MTTTLADHHRAWHNTFGKYATCDLDCGAGEIVGETFEADAQVLRQLEADGARGLLCGSCKGRHATVATVRFCYEVKYDSERFARADAAMAAAIEAEGECVHGLSQALCADPIGHYPRDL